MWDEQYRIIKSWTHSFTSKRHSDGKHVGVIVYSKSLHTINEQTRPCSFYHNMMDDAFNRVRIRIQEIVDRIEVDKK